MTDNTDEWNDIGFDLQNLPRRWVHVPATALGNEQEFSKKPTKLPTLCIYSNGHIETVLCHIITFVADGSTKVVPPRGDGWTYVGRDRRSSRWQRPTRCR
jgi:hypothetical protein